MTIRPAQLTDVDAVTTLEAEVFGADAWSSDSVREELAGPGRHAVVAEVGGAVVGYAVTRRSHDVVDLQRIGVLPTMRRTGVARSMLDEARRNGRAEGGHRMLLEVSVRNEAALAFYVAEGFAEIDRRPRYYRDGSDALVLGAPLAVAAGRGRTA